MEVLIKEANETTGRVKKKKKVKKKAKSYVGNFKYITDFVVNLDSVARKPSVCEYLITMVILAI